MGKVAAFRKSTSCWKFFLFSTFFFSLISGLSLKAQDIGVSGINLEYYRPAIDSFGYYGVNGPTLLPAGAYCFKLSQSLTGGSLLKASINNQTVDLINRIYTTDLVGSLAITDFLTVGADLPIHLLAKEANFNTLASFTTSSLGDVRMALKFRLLEEKNIRPGIAFLFTNSFPTGNENKFLGTTHMVPGVEVIIGKRLKGIELAANVGALFPEKKTVLGVNFDDQIIYGTAVKIPFGFWDPSLALVSEVRGGFQINKFQALTAPLEFTAGLKKDFESGLSVSAGAGGAWNNAMGSPRVRGVISVGYASRIKTATDKPAKIVAHQTIEKPTTTAYFRVGSSQISRESIRWIQEDFQRLRNPSLKIKIKGYTDSTGSKSKNKKLSERRANQVKKMLINLGINPKSIEIEGLGDEQPVADNATRQGRRLNRRVEILVSH